MSTMISCTSSGMVRGPSCNYHGFSRLTVNLGTVWADHADTISKSYSGTGALKTDYTRTGKRTKEGYLADGVNSVMRYVKNNFFDGSRQVRTG
jgi:hypothetical protein